MGRESGGEATVGRRSGRAGALAAAGIAACVLALGCQQADPTSDLRERVTKYWQLKQSKSWPEVYDQYVDPNVKTTLTKEAFLKRRFLAFDIFSFQIADIADEGDEAKVAVTNEVNFPLKAPSGEMQFIKKQVTTNDTWVRRDGAWYVELRE